MLGRQSHIGNTFLMSFKPSPMELGSKYVSVCLQSPFRDSTRPPCSPCLCIRPGPLCPGQAELRLLSHTPGLSHRIGALGWGSLTSPLSSGGKERSFLRSALPRHTPEAQLRLLQIGNEERCNIHLCWNSNL